MKNLPKRIISAALALLMLSMSALLCGCGASGEPIEDGLYTSYAFDDERILYCGYKSDNNEFFIGHVFITVYYGDRYPSGIDVALQGRSYPKFYLYFSNDKGDMQRVRTVRENLISEKYSCTIPHFTGKGGEAIEFNHSETLLIPAYLFKGESGFIYFSIRGTNVRQENGEEKHLGGVKIRYEVDGTRVKLYTEK